MKKIFISITIATLIVCDVSHAQTNTFPSTAAAGIGNITPNESSLSKDGDVIGYRDGPEVSQKYHHFPAGKRKGPTNDAWLV